MCYYSLQTFTKETYVFDGFNNSLVKKKRLVTDWTCTFEMSMYPFGSQKCTMVLYGGQPNMILEIENISYTGNY